MDYCTFNLQTTTMAKSKKSLAETHPELVKEWHPTLNGNLVPCNFTYGSSKKVWWLCDKGPDHVWSSIISKRGVDGRGCPVCAGRKVVLSNCLATLNPTLADEWHPDKNATLFPTQVTPYSNRKVWWQCNQDKNHEWQSTINNRSQGKSCPFCTGRKVSNSNSLASTHPKLAKEWHPTLNGELTPNHVSQGSTKKVWWKCDKGEDHIWQSTVANRKPGQGCPACSGLKVVPSNCLANVNKELAREWHPTMNGKLTPFEVTYNSGKRIWWKCNKGEDHIWRVSVNSRQRRELKSLCPICTNRVIVASNSLVGINPQLADEWHPTLNGNLLPNQIGAGTALKVWWKCDKGEDHEWRASVVSRNRGSGCPYCTLTPQSKQELIITFELKTFFSRIDPRGFKARLDGRLRAIDIFIPKLNLCIEFDGSYWHKEKREIDKIKSNLLLKEGYSVIRVREEPLKKIHDTDVVSKQPYDGKQVTNDILSMILSMYDLDSELIQRIKDYQSKDDLQNERGLNRYIDKILKEKAEKK